MQQWMYVEEKLLEIRSSKRPALTPVAPATVSRRPLGPVARRTGSVLRRLGEALESWSTPLPERAAAEPRA